MHREIIEGEVGILGQLRKRGISRKPEGRQPARKSRQKRQEVLVAKVSKRGIEKTLEAPGFGNKDRTESRSGSEGGREAGRVAAWGTRA